ncbi:MAG TPA: hypothetical protein DCG57_03480 [Candidatus Riflebacteria bacterium]|jgi:phage repressor protein C with HTH and peptisase S24 domain|nr:hypothetical protein [Candidatus Riflebacteria bacterium]
MASNFDDFHARLKQAIGNESVNSFAKKCEVSESLLRKYLSGDSLPGTKALVAISEYARVSLEWLATGKGPIIREDATGKHEITEFKDRLRITCGINDIRTAAEKLHLHPEKLDKYLSGEEEPFLNEKLELAELGHVNPQWLIDGKGEIKPRPSYEIATNKESYFITNLEGRQVKYEPSPDLWHIPVLSLEAACGNGTLISTESIKAIFSATEVWFRRELGANPANLCLIQARGDSMVTTIMPEEMVFVDRSCVVEPCDGIWVFRNEEALFIKRLQFFPGRKVEVTSDNPRYKPYTMAISESFALLGQVIAALPLRRL